MFLHQFSKAFPKAFKSVALVRKRHDLF